MDTRIVLRLNRRELLKWGGAAVLGGVADLRADSGPGSGSSSGLVCAMPEPAPKPTYEACAGGSPIEMMPTSPLIGGYVDSNGVVRGSAFTEELQPWDPLPPRPLPGGWDNSGAQDSDRHSHSLLPEKVGLPEPVFYRLRLDVGARNFTSLKALPIDSSGHPMSAYPRSVPASTVYKYNVFGPPGSDFCPPTFKPALIYAQYGYPALVRFENHLHENPCSLDRGDFGDPEFGFLTHLHNGHTASESDGNPNHMPKGYLPCQFSDNLYLNWPPNFDDNEKQSFLWFHDHKEFHTGANVYKGLFGFYFLYDPDLDPGDETSSGSKGRALHLPGVPVQSGFGPSAPKRVEYDIPLALFDCALDDGVTPHKDFHNGCGEVHPEWSGQLYFRHFPNHGFVGDVFTVNEVAYPVLNVKRRKYRLRFIDISVARLYRLMLMWSSSAPQAVPGRAGQYQLPDAQQCMRFTQIASEGGLLPFPIDRDWILLSPAKRREVIVDFSRYMDGWPTTKGDCLYLVNVLRMDTGRKEDDVEAFDPNYVVPILKIEIGDPAPDYSQIPAKLRDLPEFDFSCTPSRRLEDLPRREFRLERGSAGGEDEWLINGLPFQPGSPLAFPRKDCPEVWIIENGGGGWTHPMHFHQEEHRVLSRNGVKVVAPPPRPAVVNGAHVDDYSKEDTIALDPGATVEIYRNFRSFKGKYVAHCHNLAHEDHNMMFGWDIV